MGKTTPLAHLFILNLLCHICFVTYITANFELSWPEKSADLLN